MVLENGSVNREAEGRDGDVPNPLLAMKVHPRALLFYDSRCWICRILSALCVGLSLRGIRRLSLAHEEAHHFHHHYPEAPGRLALATRRGITYDEQVFSAVFRLVFRSWLALFRPLDKNE